MYVQSLEISGFASFEQVRWCPERLNALIGLNGSGKSNLLRALDLIRASAIGALHDFVLDKGGFPRLLWGGLAQQMKFQIVADLTVEGATVVYPFELGAVSQSASYRIVRELLVFADGSAPQARLLNRFMNELQLQEGGLIRPIEPAQAPPETETALSTISVLWPHQVPYKFQQYLRAWAIYHDLRVDEHAEIRRPAVIRDERRVSRDGQNLIPVLRALYVGNFRDAIDKGMSAAFPNDYGELAFRFTEPDRVQLYIRRKQSSREDSAADLSDGTLRFLLLLAILATPDPPPLIAIDEPEAGLHPSMLPIIAEFAAEAATRTQVILSTHSPQMLDAFGDTLPATTIFEWAGDRTELKTIRGDELKKWVQEYSLGRFIFSGEAAAVL